VGGAAADAGDVPVGAVVVRDGHITPRRNRRNSTASLRTPSSLATAPERSMTGG
jgi:hypothetical protein